MARIRLSRFDLLSNFDNYVKWLSDDELFEFLSSRTPRSNEKEIIRYIQEQKRNGSIFLPVIYSQNNEHIGNLKIYNFDEENGKKYAEYSRFIGEKKYHGKGLGTELGNLALDYCFNELNLDFVIAGCFADNIGAIKSNIKLGFQEHSRFEDCSQEHNPKIIKFRIKKEDFLKT